MGKADAVVWKVLCELAKEYKTTEPRWGWRRLDGYWGMYGIGMLLDHDLATLYYTSLEGEQLLRHVVAHEFRHHLTYAKHMGIPVPKGRKYRDERRAKSEEQAERFAEERTGLSHEAFRVKARDALSDWRDYYYGL